MRYNDAVESATVLLAHSELAGTAPGIPNKGNWSTIVIGAYDLIFPHLHIDIPTRLEVYTAVQNTMMAHHSGTPHFGKKSHPGGYTAAVLPAKDPNEVEGGPGLVRAIGDNVSAIGYGVS